MAVLLHNQTAIRILDGNNDPITDWYVVSFLETERERSRYGRVTNRLHINSMYFDEPLLNLCMDRMVAGEAHKIEAKSFDTTWLFDKAFATSFEVDYIEMGDGTVCRFCKSQWLFNFEYQNGLLHTDDIFDEEVDERWSFYDVINEGPLRHSHGDLLIGVDVAKKPEEQFSWLDEGF